MPITYLNNIQITRIYFISQIPYWCINHILNLFVMKKINKLIAILLVAVCVLSGCAGSNTGKQEETVTMRATVTSFEKAGFLVTPEDGSEELKSSDSFYISSQYLPEDTELQVGDQVEITYSGYIKEIYPALLEKITEVKILESGTEE